MLNHQRSPSLSFLMWQLRYFILPMWLPFYFCWRVPTFTVAEKNKPSSHDYWIELDRALLRNLLPSFLWGPRSWFSFLSLGHPDPASLYSPWYPAGVVAQSPSCVWLSVAPWTVACQVPLPMEFSRQEYWRGLPAGDVELKGWINVQTHVDFFF